jgi:hypothetical protein
MAQSIRGCTDQVFLCRNPSRPDRGASLWRSDVLDLKFAALFGSRAAANFKSNVGTLSRQSTKRRSLTPKQF